jgi:WD40 repeat protein
MSLPAARVQKTQAIIPRQKFEGHTSFVLGVLHLRDGQRIMTCSVDGSLRVWDMESGKQIGEDWRDDEGTTMNTIALSPDGKKVLSGGGDGTVRLWDIDTAKVIAKWTGHTAHVRSLCWNGAERVVCGANDGIRVWDAETHVHLVMKPRARPLHTFRTIKEFVKAIRDIVISQFILV